MAVPMRDDVHGEWDERRGRFRGWSQDRRARYSIHLVERTQWAWNCHKNPDVIPF